VAVSTEETSESHIRSPVSALAKWKKKPRWVESFFQRKRRVVSTRSVASGRVMRPRLWPMQTAVRQKPVAATLATTRLSGARTLKRSLTKPVCGLACSQKKQKSALMMSSRKLMSSGERVLGAGGGAKQGDEDWGCCAAPSKGRMLRPARGRAKPREAACRSHSRRVSFRFLSPLSPTASILNEGCSPSGGQQSGCREDNG